MRKSGRCLGGSSKQRTRVIQMSPSCKTLCPRWKHHVESRKDITEQKYQCRTFFVQAQWIGYPLLTLCSIACNITPSKNLKVLGIKWPSFFHVQWDNIIFTVCRSIMEVRNRGNKKACVYFHFLLLCHFLSSGNPFFHFIFPHAKNFYLIFSTTTSNITVVK